MSDDDPWRGISTPIEAGNLNRRRASTKIDLYWGVDGAKNVYLLYLFGASIQLKNKLPKLDQIEFSCQSYGDDQKIMFLKLENSNLKELFEILTRDIVKSCENFTEQNDVIDEFTKRTLKWHSLLKKGHDGRLTLEEQKGLIGECALLNKILSAGYLVADAVHAWVGPDGAPKDFEFGKSFVEVKATSSNDKPLVSISNQFQLDCEVDESVLLYACRLSPCGANDPNGKTLTEFVRQTYETVRDAEIGAEIDFEAKLYSTGFSWDHDYSDKHWILGVCKFYRTNDHFPKLVPSQLPNGILSVAYKIDIESCGEFEISDSDAMMVIKSNAEM